MKKVLAVAGVASMLTILGSCDSDSLAGDTNSTLEEQSVESEEVAIEEVAIEEEATEEVLEEAKLEVVNSTGAAWKNSIDTVWVHSSAVFENTGDVPVSIGETQMNFKDTEGGILGTASMIYAIPSVVAPGEQAYISETTILDSASSPEAYLETTYNFSFDPTDESANLLEVSGVKGIPATDEFANPYKVTGIIKNTTEELQGDIRLAAALFAEDGSLLGVLNGSVDVGVNPGSEAGFELSYPEIPKEVADQVATVDVKAYGWSW